MPNNVTKDNVLDVAQELLQTRGFNAFSYRDLADRVRITTASIHYHFPTKGELCRALIARHDARVKASLDAIDAKRLDALKALDRYADVYRSTLEAGNRMCLCGMLAAEVATLDPAIVAELRASFDRQEDWLDRVLTEGKAAGTLHFEGDARDEARLLLASLEGAMLLARTYEDHPRFNQAARRLLSKLRAKSKR